MPFDHPHLARRLPLSLSISGALLLLLGTLLLTLTLAPAQVAAQPEPTDLPLYALPDASRNRAVSSSSIAITSDNRLLVVANMLSNSASIVNAAARELLVELPVGLDPRSVAITADNTRALVVNRGAGTLSVIDLIAQTVVSTIPVGVLPYGVVILNDQTAYVSVQGSGEIAVVDISIGAVTLRIPTGGSPAGLALWGDFLYITDLWSGELRLIYLPQMRVVRTIATGADSSLFQSLEIDVTRGIAYLPHSRSNAQNPNLTYDTTVFPVVNVVALSSLTLLREARIALDIVDRPVNSPFAVALDRFQQRLFVANAGTNDVTEIDLVTGRVRTNIPVGANPRGLILNRDSSLLYVHNTLDATVSIVQVSSSSVIGVLPVSDLRISTDLLLGAQFFHTAQNGMSADGWLSCANCHFDGQSDGRVWRGFEGGGRNTPTLFGLEDTAPYNWTGTWDELADSELKIRGLQAGSGLIDGPVFPPRDTPHAGVSLDLDSLVLYLDSLSGPAASPLTASPDLIAQGAEIFTAQNCSTCHASSAFTDGASYDVGTGGTFNTPSLRWLWTSAPYFHDGRAATLGDLFALPGAHQLIQTLPQEQIDALIAYLLSL